jgi:hypothetical protein
VYKREKIPKKIKSYHQKKKKKKKKKKKTHTGSIVLFKFTYICTFLHTRDVSVGGPLKMYQYDDYIYTFVIQKLLIVIGNNLKVIMQSFEL